MLLQLGLAALAVLTVVLAGSAVAASRLAEREAVNGAAKMTDLLAVSVVQPALVDVHVARGAGAAAAARRLDRQVVLADDLHHRPTRGGVDPVLLARTVDHGDRSHQATPSFSWRSVLEVV